MNTTKTAAIATLIFLGANSGHAAGTPAWMDEGFIMEEVVATAEAPAHLYMEEIVVTAKAPDHLYMEEIVVTAQAPAAEPMEEVVVTARAPAAEPMEEVVVTASLEDVRDARLARLMYLRLALLDRT